MMGIMKPENICSLRTFEDFYPYQEKAIKQSCRMKQAALFLDCGLGKTIIALTIADQLMKRDLIKSTLVVAPLKVLENVWEQEAQLWKHTQYLKFTRLRGTPAERLGKLKLPANIYLINYELLPWLCDAIRTRCNKIVPFQMILPKLTLYNFNNLI